ncbi:MAG: SPOR domain-containing protein [Brevundimonas sp.]
MTPAPATRPVLIALTLVLTGCGAVEGDRQGFQAMAERVAAIDIPLDPQAVRADEGPRPSAQAQGLRPAKFSPAHVAVLTPHEMWDARDVLSRGGSLAFAEDKSDDGLRGAVARMAEPVVEPALRAAAPVVAKAMVEQAVARTEAPMLRPAVADTAPPVEGRMVQLGAYSSRAGAQAAWTQLKTRASLSNLSPVFEGVEVNGRSLTRLKVGPIPVEAASALCAAAQVADPWCRRAG